LPDNLIVAVFTVIMELPNCFSPILYLGDARNEKSQSSCNEPCLRGDANGGFLRSPGQSSSSRWKTSSRREK